MFSTERQITLQRQERRGSTTNSVAQQKMVGEAMFGRKRTVVDRERRKLKQNTQYN